MKLVTGTLYFISEVDVFTSQEFDYFKIGLVKESRKGDSFDRLSEHQTGNPRKLVIRHTIDTPAISTLESAVHGLYATERVFGEWFHLPGTRAQAVMNHAGVLAGEQFELAKAAQLAMKYATKESNGRTLQATSEAKEHHLIQQQANFELKALAAIFSLERIFFESLSSTKFDTSLFFSKVPRSTPKFDEFGLAAKHPRLYKNFVSEEVSLSSKFLISKMKDQSFTLPATLKSEIAEQELRIAAMSKSPTFTQVKDIHMQHLKFLRYEADAKWREDNAKAVIRSLIKSFESINGVAKWTRVQKSATVFDKKRFGEKYPEILMEFSSFTPSSKFDIVNMRRYPGD